MYMYGIIKGGGKIDSKSYGYNKEGNSVGFLDLEELLRGNGAWVKLRSFGSEQEDLFLETEHREHRCACGKQDVGQDVPPGMVTRSKLGM